MFMICSVCCCATPCKVAKRGRGASGKGGAMACKFPAEAGSTEVGGITDREMVLAAIALQKQPSSAVKPGGNRCPVAMHCRQEVDRRAGQKSLVAPRPSLLQSRQPDRRTPCPRATTSLRS